MKRTSILTIVGVLMVALTLVLCSGCGKEQGAEFIGTWKQVSSVMQFQNYTTIQKGNGDSFIITKYVVNKNNPEQSRSKTYSGVYDNGRIKFASDSVLYLDGDTLKSHGSLVGDSKKISDKILTLNELNK